MTDQTIAQAGQQKGRRLDVLLGLTLLGLLLLMWIALSIETTTFWTANNMANLNTVGFKAEEMMVSEAGVKTKSDTTPFGRLVSFVRDEGTVRDAKEGPLQKTGALISQGGTNTAVNTKSLLTQLADLTPLLQTAGSLASLSSSGTTATATLPSTTISSGTYNSTTGLVTLTNAASLGLEPGMLVEVSGATGTGSYADINGTWPCAAGTSITFALPANSALEIACLSIAWWAASRISSCSNIPVRAHMMFTMSVTESMLLTTPCCWPRRLNRARPGSPATKTFSPKKCRNDRRAGSQNGSTE